MLEQARLTAEMMPPPCPYCGISLLAHVDAGIYIRCEVIRMSSLPGSAPDQ